LETSKRSKRRRWRNRATAAWASASFGYGVWAARKGQWAIRCDPLQPFDRGARQLIVCAYREETRSMWRCVYRKRLDLGTPVCTRGPNFSLSHLERPKSNVWYPTEWRECANTGRSQTKWRTGQIEVPIRSAIRTLSDVKRKFQRARQPAQTRLCGSLRQARPKRRLMTASARRPARASRSARFKEIIILGGDGPRPLGSSGCAMISLICRWRR
jgi:hypothetical protein